MAAAAEGLQEGDHCAGAEEEAVERRAPVGLHPQEVPLHRPERHPAPSLLQHRLEDGLRRAGDAVAVGHRVHGPAPQEEQARQRLRPVGPGEGGQHAVAGAVAAVDGQQVDAGRPEPLHGRRQLVGRGGVGQLAVAAQAGPQARRQPGVPPVALRQRVVHDAHSAHAALAPLSSPLQVVLVSPQIPPNTGNVVRTCAVTGSPAPPGRSARLPLDDRHLRRAGLDYWPDVQPAVYRDWHDFAARTLGGQSPGGPDAGRLHLFTARAPRNHLQARYAPGDFLLFGHEQLGLPPALLEAWPERQRAIPMLAGKRSLNLAVAVGIALYAALEQLGDAGGLGLRGAGRAALDATHPWAYSGSWSRDRPNEPGFSVEVVAVEWGDVLLARARRSLADPAGRDPARGAQPPCHRRAHGAARRRRLAALHPRRAAHRRPGGDRDPAARAHAAAGRAPSTSTPSRRAWPAWPRPAARRARSWSRWARSAGSRWTGRWPSSRRATSTSSPPWTQGAYRFDAAEPVPAWAGQSLLSPLRTIVDALERPQAGALVISALQPVSAGAVRLVAPATRAWPAPSAGPPRSSGWWGGSRPRPRWRPSSPAPDVSPERARAMVAALLLLGLAVPAADDGRSDRRDLGTAWSWTSRSCSAPSAGPPAAAAGPQRCAGRLRRARSPQRSGRGAGPPAAAAPPGHAEHGHRSVRRPGRPASAGPAPARPATPSGSSARSPTPLPVAGPGTAEATLRKALLAVAPRAREKDLFARLGLCPGAPGGTR